MTEARAHVEYDLPGDGLIVTIVEGPPGQRVQVYWADGPWAQRRHLDPATAAREPSLFIPQDAARALLDALLDHFGNATGGRLQRADFEHERKRRDLLEDALMKLVTE